MGFLDETLFGFSNAVKADEKEKKLMMLLLEEFANYDQKNGSFLLMLNLNEFDFYFNDATKTDGVLGGYSIIKPFSISMPEYGNQTTIDKCMMALSIAAHELNHAFQFGIPIKSKDIKMITLSKFVMPICYVFNNLLTKLIDNSITSMIMPKIYKMIGKKDIDPDNAHIPFLYKITIEHDSDKLIDMNEKLSEFIIKLEKCIAGVRYINKQILRNEKSDLNVFDKTSEQLDNYTKEHGRYFMGLAMKIVELYDVK